MDAVLERIITVNAWYLQSGREPRLPWVRISNNAALSALAHIVWYARKGVRAMSSLKSPYPFGGYGRQAPMTAMSYMILFERYQSISRACRVRAV